MSKPDVIIIGAGLAGLCCARRLSQSGRSFAVLEKADAVGGRVRTDRLEGFLLDRGFQVLLTAYPECKNVLDYDALRLRPFLPGALIRHGGRFHRLSDPWRDPLRALESALSPVGTLADKLRIARLRFALRRRSLERVFAGPEKTTVARLRELGFSNRIIESFFRPFLGGVFLDSRLETSSRMFEFVFKMFAAGQAAVPARGMQAIPESIAAKLPSGSVRLRSEVRSVERTRCTLTTGETLDAGRIVIATDGADAAGLLPGLPNPRWRRTECFYYDAPQAPIDEPVLVLDGEGRGPVNNLCVMSRVSPEYAPAGRALVSISTVADPDQAADLEGAIRRQMAGWFGDGVEHWRLLNRYSVSRALPAGGPPATHAEPGPVLVCGDHVEHASIHGAMRSGRRAAEAIVADADGTGVGGNGDGHGG